ncbi:MOSC domain-containing protein [Paenibacillus sp. LHD-38]|uniref:MOSC domain-containing protein n=1 Tax=Paenibacillus sp. LHD-38 TaxID=3072143 RepID=UPI00280FEC3F|nr:MOSC domain-containing protein [Paenibacillus sp. LHD-38]MDQ8734635.1 MOSC domain-containing protein [Paenibacillus sp. LHD-38]
MSRIGLISAINRYPVKSFAGEGLDACQIDTYGLKGDRCHAFFDETKEGWDSFFTARDIPAMLSYKAKLVDENAKSDDAQLKITSPEGRNFGWDDDLLTEMQRYSKKKMLMRSYQTQSPDLKAVDEGSILIIIDTSLRKLEALWGKPLDERRFRANIVVKVDESGFSEKDWIGKRLSVGSAQLHVDKYCDRCSMVTLDPDTLERDGSLLRKINEEMRLNFGVYASVEKTGVIHAGDQVHLMDR